MWQTSLKSVAIQTNSGAGLSIEGDNSKGWHERARKWTLLAAVGKSRNDKAVKPAPSELYTYADYWFRVLYAIFILSNLLNVTYGIPPVVSIIQDGEVEMPDEEILWNAPTEDEWHQRLQTKHFAVSPSLRDAVARLMYGKKLEGLAASCWNWSPFSVTVVMHAVSVQLWHIMQCTQSFDVLMVHDKSPKSVSTGQAEMALARCHAMISQGRCDGELTWNESEGPLVFNSLALLRACYVRAFTGVGSFNRMALLNDDSEEVLSSIWEYVKTSQERSPFLTKAVARTFEGFLTPIKAGALLVQKTAALSWSIEHAIAGWDCGKPPQHNVGSRRLTPCSALFFTKWIHSIEKLQYGGAKLDDAELQNVHNVHNLLVETGTEISTRTSLAAELTRLWAGFYDDTWVWGGEQRDCYIFASLLSLKFPLPL